MKKQIQKFDKPTAQMLRQELNDAIQAVCRKYGINTTGIGNIRYDANHLRTSLELVTESIMVKPEEDLNAYVGRTFQQGRAWFEITGVRGTDELLGIKSTNGKTYRIKVEHLLNMTEVKL